MKKLFILLNFLFLIPISVNATDSNYDSNVPITGAIGHTGDNRDLPSDDDYLVKFDANFNIVATAVFDNPNYRIDYFVDSYKEHSNSNIYIFERRFISGNDSSAIRVIDKDLNTLYEVPLPASYGLKGSLKIADNRIFIGTSTGFLFEIDLTGQVLWTNTNHTSEIKEIFVKNGFIYTISSDRTARKFDYNGNQQWSFTEPNFTPSDIAVDDNGNSIIIHERGNSDQIIILNQFGSKTAFREDYLSYDHNDIILLDNNNFLILSEDFNSSFSTVLEMDLSTNIINSTSTGVSYDSEIRFNANTNRFYLFNSRDPIIYEYDSSFNLINTYDYQTQLWDEVDSIAFTTAVTEPPTYTVDITSNYAPYTDFIYNDGIILISNSSISTVINNDQGFVVTSSQINISPFSFNFWYDLTNQQIFNSNRIFEILDPDRNYNLIGNFSLNQAVTLNIDSNLPSPPQFAFNTRSIENNPIVISQYPFNNYQHPIGYEFEIIAPTNNIGFYEFDYWYDNENEEVYSLNTSITSSALQNLNLTATYSLPEEYQINLTLDSQIGVITFQHGSLDPITGTSISVTIGEGDTWSAFAPEDSDFKFDNWIDLDTLQEFSTNKNITVGYTSQNYNLRAFYKELYTVNWDSNGGSLISPQKFTSDDLINPPTEPVRPNFIFDGWEDEDNNLINFPISITEDVTFTAIWLPTYILTFNTNGGSAIPTQEIVENNTPTAVTPSRFGYTFDGWFTDNITFQNPFDFNQPFTQNTIIHAKWEFGTVRDAEVSLNSFFTDAGLDNPIAQWIIVLALFIFLNVMIFIYKGPFIVTIILNFILTALFIVLGFIPIWITIIIFMALFGFGILMFTGGRS